MLKLCHIHVGAGLECLFADYLTLDEVARVAFPHGRWDNVEERVSWLGLTLADTTWDYGAGIGHLGVSDQFVALDHLLATGALAPGDYVLLIGVGAGKTLACAVLRILDIPKEYAPDGPGRAAVRIGPRPHHPGHLQRSPVVLLPQRRQARRRRKPPCAPGAGRQCRA
ncbi:3-oxoacyl-[acyl-carrier-protein] synthase III C-terminal domain-containing protein [Nonomuraea sp. NPDC049695]|uniref:3-oxoacyl-[acyl-carrier-protein] synthase III C-terminal domain-containing protein n=1 Tax=Nonomuraea sp. NPDC049695 TaxID=3154734 RepID=UPI003418A3AC